MVEHSAVNRVVVGSSPTRGVFFFLGSMVKRLRHRPFTAVTRVQIPLESFLAQQCAELKVISRMPMWLNSRQLRRNESIVGRAAGYKSAGKSHADVAQLAEQLICNQQVIGSSPIIGFLKEQESLNKDH